MSRRASHFNWLFPSILLLAGRLVAADHPYPEAVFEQAMVAESAEGGLEAATTLYRKVIAEAGSDHLLAAKARLRLGSCDERLGKTAEARDIYLQIITDAAVTPVEIADFAKDRLRHLQPETQNDQ
jgi:hypothetical protein